MTTIITKNGSGAPTAGQIAQGELAVDLTNKRLYTENTGGAVIEVGTNPTTLTASGLIYPTSDGSDGQAIITDGSGTLSFGAAGIGYSTQTSNYTMASNEGVIANTSGGTFTVTLPASPATGNQVIIADGNDWETTNLIVGRNGSTIEGVASDLTMDVGGIAVTMVYDGTTWQLYPATGTSDSTTYTLDQTTTAGNTTTNDITVGNLTSTGIDDNATSTAITIDANENVGVGTAAPDGKLNVFSASAGNVSADADADELVLENSGNVGLSLLTATTGESSIYFGNPGSGGQKDFSLKYYHESHPDTAKRRSFAFNNSSQQLMSVTNGGNVLVGKTSLSYGTDGFQVEQSGAIGGSRTDGPPAVWNRNGSNGDLVLYRRNNNTVGSVYCTTTATTYGTSSDVRLKRNIVDAPAGNIDDIKIRSFAWKIDGSQQKYGVVAQELFEVAPEAVTKGETEEDTWGVDYSKLVPMMIKEIQDLKAEVAALKGVN